MANGGPDVTNGGRPEWPPLAIIAAVSVVVALVNVASHHTDIARAGLDTSKIEPWIWEFSSALATIMLSPLIVMVVKRFPPSRARWPRLVLVHLAAGTAFSAAHIVGMVALRELAYLGLPWGYDFDRGELVNEVLYEWRKDLITYAVIAGGYWLWRTWRAAEATQPAAGEERGALRIEVRDGARVLMLEAAAIRWIEAAGNYVEIHTANGRHIARGTLASFAERLEGAGFVRIHRSRLVNPESVSGYQPTASGDVEVEMSDGTKLAGSRRFRAALAAALREGVAVPATH